MSADYRKMYLALVGPVDDVVTLLERGGSGEEAAKRLICALRTAEEIYITTEKEE